MVDPAVENARSDRRILLFDLALGGHHGNYIQHLVNYWCEEDLPGSLDIVVSPDFLHIHHDTVSVIEKHQHPAIKLLPITTGEADRLIDRSSGLKRTRRNFQEWHLYQQYASSQQATSCLLMYFDTCELPLAVGMSSPCPFSGIYFRPTFHYPLLRHYVPSKQERRQQWREKLTLSRILRHPQLKTLFCLDPFVVKYLDHVQTKAAVVPLPDPVHLETCTESKVKELREKLGIECGRKVFLLFGALDGRKGIYQLLDAIALLPQEFHQQFCLLLVGATSSSERAKLQPRITALSQTYNVQIIERYEFVSESDVAAYFHLSDVVLAPYQKHVGMSGILLLAAAVQTPVLSSNFGLMGEIVRRYELGIAVDSTQPEEITDGLIRSLEKPPETFCDRTKMQNLAEQNSVKHYAKAIFQNI